MKQVHDYFYAVAAACVVAIGTGFLSVVEHQWEYERRAFEVAYNYEKKSNNVLNRETGCSSEEAQAALCRHAHRLMNTSESILSLYDKIYKLLVLVGSASLVAGVVVHVKSFKASTG